LVLPKGGEGALPPKPPLPPQPLKEGAEGPPLLRDALLDPREEVHAAHGGQLDTPPREVLEDELEPP
jgi:hypothetical protein